MAPTLREELAQEIQKIPDDRLGEVVSFLHRFRLGLRTDPEGRPATRRQPSLRLAYQGARLVGDDRVPVIPPEEWSVLSDHEDGLVS